VSPREHAALAILLAMSNAAPERWSKFGFMAYIPRELIDAARGVLSNAGLDWRKVRREERSARVRA
jgi:hypothetical protein